MDQQTDKTLGLVERVAQSIEEILTTPTDTRPAQLDFGNNALAMNGSIKPGLTPATMAARAIETLRRNEERATFSNVDTVTTGGIVTGYRVAYDITDEPGPRVQLVELPAARD